jgi:hypothetical protein
MECPLLRITGLFTHRRLRRLELRKTAVGLTALVRFFSATFWPAAMLRIALWAGQNVAEPHVRNSRNVVGNRDDFCLHTYIITF